MSNNIGKIQNNSKQITRLAAQRVLYSRVKTAAGLKAVIAILFALIGFAFAEDPQWKGLIFMGTISFLILDIFLIEYLQKRWKNEAATIQEMFDTDVLCLPWDNIRCGKPLDEGSILRIGQKISPEGKNKLIDWYPDIDESKPVSFARIICQHSTTSWDLGLRKLYSDLVLALLVIGTILVMIISFRLNITVVKFFTLIPILLNAFRYYKDLFKSNKVLKSLTSTLDELIKLASQNKITDEELTQQSRNIQGVIFEHRKESVVIFDFIYNRLRDSFENSMRVQAKEF